MPRSARQHNVRRLKATLSAIYRAIYHLMSIFPEGACGRDLTEEEKAISECIDALYAVVFIVEDVVERSTGRGI